MMRVQPTSVALVAAISALVAPTTASFAGLMSTGIVLGYVATTDLSQHRIPNAVTYPALCCCLVACAVAGLEGDLTQLARATAGAAMFGVALLVPHLWDPRLMGRGDVKLAVPLGFGVGWVQRDVHAVVPAISWTIVVACAIGLAMGAATSRGRRLRGTPVPFGPALSVAGWGAVALTLAQR